MVALAVMMLLFTIILVPINMALDVFHIGKARNEVQQANRLVINQIAADLKQAVFVYPNEEMPGITDKSPYTSNSNYPYYNTSATSGVSNTSRIDMLLPARSTNGSVITPTKATNYIVTYYARRYDNSKTFDTYSNPVVLFRAQYPYQGDDGSATVTDNSSSRYPIGSSPYTGKTWLLQNENSEPDLLSLCGFQSTSAQSANHIQITPRDMALVAPSADATPTPNYQPDTSFICDDTDNDGKIDRVTISLHQAKYDSIGARSESQQLRSTQVVDLPNIK
jgi:hypothetical protein